MGWTEYHASYYDNKGKVDRKAECDSYWNSENYRVLKSCMKGNIYYAAVENLTRDKKTVFAVIIVTSADNKNYYNFAYKPMDESYGPLYYDCPSSILDLLTNTDSEYALEWREKCRKKQNSRKVLNNLPIGAKISFKRSTGDDNSETIVLIKYPPGHQFRNPWWKVDGENCYYQKKRIPMEFEVLKEG